MRVHRPFVAIAFQTSYEGMGDALAYLDDGARARDRAVFLNGTEHAGRVSLVRAQIAVCGAGAPDDCEADAAVPMPGDEATTQEHTTRALHIELLPARRDPTKATFKVISVTSC